MHLGDIIVNKHKTVNIQKNKNTHTKKVIVSTTRLDKKLMKVNREKHFPYIAEVD